VAGWNPRLAVAALDETTPLVRTVRDAQAMIQRSVFPNLHTTRAMVPARTTTEAMALDYGVLSAGVGYPTEPIHVTTTAAENERDGFFPNGKVALFKFSLLVMLPVEREGEIVINFVRAHASSNNVPAPTATAKAKAIKLFREKTAMRAFSSPMMPGYGAVVVRDGRYVITSSNPQLPDKAWRFDQPNTIDATYIEFDDPDAINLDVTDDAQVVRWATERMPKEHAVAMITGWREGLRTALVANQPATYGKRKILLRLLGMLKQEYVAITPPVPALDGGLGSDQRAALPGDWLVWRLLLAVARICPGALEAKQVPNFRIVDARLLRMVEAHVTALADELAEAPLASLASTVGMAPMAAVAWAPIRDAMQAYWQTHAEPFSYQQSLVDTLVGRDATSIVKTPGHYVSLDTGLGKSFIGLRYALLYAARHSEVEYILWVTPASVVPTFFTEATGLWGLAAGVVNRVSPEAPVLAKGKVNIVGFEVFQHNKQREKLEPLFIGAASASVIVFDEAHRYYGAGVRNSILREAALLCSKFVAMSATPIGTPQQAYALDWLRDTVGFPINRKNQLVGAAMMVAARVELDIEPIESIVEVDLSSSEMQVHTQLLQNGRNWKDASVVCRNGTQKTLLDTAVAEARRDRAKPDFANGGCLLVFDNKSEMQVGMARLVAEYGLEFAIAERTEAAEADPNVGIICVTRRDTTGYNMQRFGAVVTGVYEGSPADRRQLRGRIRRAGQKRKEVQYVTVIPKRTILSLLFARHNSVDAMNASLEALADKFD
jgi:hypothetical protein